MPKNTLYTYVSKVTKKLKTDFPWTVPGILFPFHEELPGPGRGWGATRRHTNKKWVPIQGGAGLRNKLLVIPLNVASFQGTRCVWHVADVHQTWDDSFNNQKNLQAPTGIQYNKRNRQFSKKRIWPHITRSFFFHPCWLASPVCTTYSLKC